MAAATAVLAPPAPLLPLVAAGDQHAMGQLVRRFEPLVRAIARRRDHHAGSGDDLVQETMLRLWRSAHRFDPDRGTEPAFVAAVARNAAIDMARHRATRPVTPDRGHRRPGPAWCLTDRAGRRRHGRAVRAART